MEFDVWLQAVWDVLQADDEACLGMIRSAGGRSGAVALVDGDIDTSDALAYARTLCDLGRRVEARDVLMQVLQAAFGMPAQGPQYSLS